MQFQNRCSIETSFQEAIQGKQTFRLTMMITFERWFVINVCFFSSKNMGRTGIRNVCLIIEKPSCLPTSENFITSQAFTIRKKNDVWTIHCSLLLPPPPHPWKIRIESDRACRKHYICIQGTYPMWREDRQRENPGKQNIENGMARQATWNPFSVLSMNDLV